jgi:uncharacterized protein YndB with AHSA1/START domain
MANEELRLPTGTEVQRWVRLRRRLNAPPQRVFRAWADPEELARWFPVHIEGALAVGSRSVLTWQDRRVWWDVTRAEPDRSFAFRRPWPAAERLISEVQVTIEPVGYGSRIQLEDGPFPLDVLGALDAWVDAIEIWSDALAMLRAHLDFSVDLRVRG